MKVCWLAPYPVQRLEPALRVSRKVTAYHPCSWVVNLSKALARRHEIELHLITESTLVPESQITQQGNITFHVVKTGIPFTNRGHPPWLPLDVLTAFHSRARSLSREVKTIRPDVVHAHGTEAAYALAGIASGLPCIVSIQGIITEYQKTNPSFGFRIIQHWEQRAVRQAGYFTCRTNFDTGFIRSVNPTARIFMIHEAMNPIYFSNHWTGRGTDRLLFVGSLAPRKGLAHLLEALALVKQHRPQVVLDVIGGGDAGYVNDLRTFCRQLNVEEAVSFLGQKTAEEILQRQLEAQMFVLSSDNENSPNTLAEAMVVGMPVIASNVGGIPALVQDGVTGLLVPPKNPQALAERILWLLNHPAAQERLGQNARQVAQRHQPGVVADQTIQAYHEILGR